MIELPFTSRYEFLRKMTNKENYNISTEEELKTYDDFLEKLKRGFKSMSEYRRFLKNDKV